MGHGGVQQALELNPLKVLILAAQSLRQRQSLVARGGGAGRIQWDRLLHRAGLVGLQDLLLGNAQVGSQLLNAGGTPKLVLQFLARLSRPLVQLLQPARDADRPTLVPKVALYLTDDGGRGKGGELQPALGLEAVERQQQSHEADLGDVFEGLAAIGEFPGQEVDQVGVGLHELLPDGGVPGLVVPRKKFALTLGDGAASGFLGAQSTRYLTILIRMLPCESTL